MNAPATGAEYLHAEQFLQDGVWKDYTLTIRNVVEPNTRKSADGKLIDKHIIEFKETDKSLICGKLNHRLASFALGSGELAKWVGKQLTLYAAVGNWFGQRDVAALRVRIPSGVAKPFIKPANLGKDLTGTNQVTNYAE